MNNWKAWVGRLLPWAIASATAFLKEVVGVELTWWPTFTTLAIGAIQFILNMIKD